MSTPSIAEPLERAFDRIVDFNAVQRGTSGAQLEAAVALLQESVGIEEGQRALIAERLSEIPGSSRAPGHVLLGIILGLITADLAADN